LTEEGNINQTDAD